jgi:hypothetical protein
MIPSAQAQIDFLSNLQRLLDEGSFVATYKYALLMALADLSVEKGDDSGESLPIALTDIAEKSIQYYWRQARPFPGKKDILRQNTGRQAAVITAVGAVQAKYRHSLARARQDSRSWHRLIRKVAQIVQVMPLWRLQVVGTGQRCFLYPHDLVDGQITLLPGVAYCLRRFHPMVVRMLQGAWADEVRRLRANQPILGQRQDLLEFLFGSAREPLTAFRPILLEQQEGRCFYCEHRMRAPVVDHFIPWARYPLDLGHNFVLAHAACNAAKSDHLAALPHLENWVTRNDAAGGWLAQEFDRKGLLHDLEATQEIACWAYAQAATVDGRVWSTGTTLVALPSAWSFMFQYAEDSLPSE